MQPTVRMALVALTLTACGGTESGQQPPDDAPAPDRCGALDFSEADGAVDEFVASHGLRGASVAIVDRECGPVHSAGYGGYAADRLYLVGSSSKIVSVGVLMKLADRGLLDLDAPIGAYLSAFGSDGKPELEVAQLVSNSSGLVGLLDNPFYRPYRCQYQASGTLSDCAKAIYTADDALDRVPPDTAFHYGGGQWQLAGGVAEMVGSKPWSELLKDTYSACDVPSLGYTNPFAQSGELGSPRGYPDFFDGDVATLPETDNPNIEGGLFVTAPDYGKLLLMHLRGGECSDGRALSEAAVARMQVDRILEEYEGSTAGMAGRDNGGRGFEGYGLGWWIDRKNAGVIADPGVYGAFPWLDLPRGYGAFVALEADGDTGAQLWATLKPIIDRAFDAVRE